MPLNVNLEKRLSDLPKDTFLGPTGFYTKALFKDHPQATSSDKDTHVFYIGKEKSSEDYIALKEVYMAIEDPTEFEFAMKTFGSYRHWLHITELSWAKDYVSEWRHELAMKLKSKSIKDIVNLAGDEFVKETTKFQAMKYLANSDYAEKTTATKAKQAKVKEAIRREGDDDIASDFERLGITPIRRKSNG